MLRIDKPINLLRTSSLHAVSVLLIIISTVALVGASEIGSVQSVLIQDGVGFLQDCQLRVTFSGQDPSVFWKVKMGLWLLIMKSKWAGLQRNLVCFGLANTAIFGVYIFLVL